MIVIKKLNTKKSTYYSRFFNNIKNPWQLAIFPGGLPPSIVAASSLYDRVRDGNGCDPAAWLPGINIVP